MSTAPSAAKAPRLAALDALRLVAAVAVVVFHYTQPQQWPGTDISFGRARRLTQFGFLGVEMFFFISGFVILMTAWGRTVPQFVASRAARLLPTFWVAVAGAFLINAALAAIHHEPFDPVAGLTNLTLWFQPAGAPYLDGAHWSLYVEAIFYVVMAVFMVVGITRNRVLVMCLLWPILASVSKEPLFKWIFLDRWGGLFCAGMVLYVIYREGWRLPSALVLVSDLVLAAWEIQSQNVGSLDPVKGIPGHVLAGLGVFAAFGLVALAVLSPLARLQGRWLTWLGLLTYPLYCIHFSWGTALTKHLGPRLGGWPTLLLTVVAVTVAAIAIHVLVERRVQRPMRRVLERQLTEVDPAVWGRRP